MLVTAIAAAALAGSSAPVIVRCKLDGMPPMVLTFREGRNSTLRVGKAKPVPLLVGSSLSTATFGAQELTFSLRLPASVTVSAPGNDAKTYGGACESNLPM